MPLSTGTYIITNTETLNRVAILDANDNSSVVASLGVDFQPDAGEEWIITDIGKLGKKYTIQNARYGTYAGSHIRPEPDDYVESSDAFDKYVWNIKEHPNGDYVIMNNEMNVGWYFPDEELGTPIQLADMSDGSFPTRWQFSPTSGHGAAETGTVPPTLSINQTSNTQALSASVLQGQIGTFNATNSTFNHIGRDQVNITNVYYGTPTPSDDIDQQVQ